MSKLQTAVAVVLALAYQLALAVSPFDPLTTAVSFTDVVAALFTVAAAIVAVLVAKRGIKWVLALVGR